MTKDSWSRLAATYDADHTSITGADLVDAVREHLAATVPRGRVVELGCGTGLYTTAYAAHCEHVTALDRSPAMVEMAHCALSALPHAEAAVADATATGLADGCADAVVTVNLLHVVPDAAAVLAEARRLLHPGGVLIAVDATGRGLSARQMVAATWRILRRWGPVPPRVKGQVDLDQPGLAAVVSAAGFESAAGHLFTGSRMNAASVRALAPALAPAG